jgi:hypothetical protein
MSQELKAVELRAFILLAELDMHGMLAENKEWEFQGCAPSYIEKDFQKVHDQLCKDIIKAVARYNPGKGSE